MKVFLFSFTRQASALSLSLFHFFSKEGIPCTAFTMEKFAVSPEFTPLSIPLKEQVADCFQTDCALIFVCACGIAVRSIAPFVEKKTKDPCVLVIDEKGQFVISLLSGHIGGGNAFALRISKFLGATPVISTATDLNMKFSVDTFAKEHKLFLSDMNIAKEISSAILENIPIGLTGIIPKGSVPEGLSLSKEKTGICISAFSKPVPFSRTLFLVPKQVVLGIGCKKNTSIQAMEDFVASVLKKQHIFPEAVAAIASIDLKKEEPCLLALAKHYDIPFVTYDADTLMQVPGSFSSSSFVQSITGVDNVCERAALAYTKTEALFLRKTTYEGMTIAISLLDIALHF